jgi:hypothetical protein
MEPGGSKKRLEAFSNIHGSEPFQVWGRSPANGVALPGGMAG